MGWNMGYPIKYQKWYKLLKFHMGWTSPLCKFCKKCYKEFFVYIGKRAVIFRNNCFFIAQNQEKEVRKNAIIYPIRQKWRKMLLLLRPLGRKWIYASIAWDIWDGNGTSGICGWSSGRIRIGTISWLQAAVRSRQLSDTIFGAGNSQAESLNLLTAL